MKFALVVGAVCAHIGRAVQASAPGQVKDSMGAACEECQKKAPWLDRGDPCVCHATDVMGTFANDATKESTTASGYGHETANVGAERLPEGWTWHCRPITGTEGVWQQC